MSLSNLKVTTTAYLLMLAATWNSPASGTNLQDDAKSKGVQTLRQREIDEHLQEQKKENADFLNGFRKLPPQERVNLWKESNNRKYRKAVAFRVADNIQDILISEGTDTVPYLSGIIRNEHELYFYRFWALTILSDMDRYVPEQSLPKGVKATLVVKELNLRGALNPFLGITGRRIGANGLESLLWATKKAHDKHLQFYARYDMGLVEQELRGLSLDEQIRRWKEGACKGQNGQPEDFVTFTLQKLIVERMPESLKPIKELLINGKSSCMRRNAIQILRMADLFRMRLRTTEMGRSAIEAVHQVLLSGKVKAECAKCETPEKTWTMLSNQFYKDDFGFNPGSQGAYYAQMLHALYGEDTIRIVNLGDMTQEWAIPKFSAFITFLTDKDPLFPSWEYTYLDRYSQGFHPRFQAKMARFEEAWKQFQQ